MGPLFVGGPVHPAVAIGTRDNRLVSVQPNVRELKNALEFAFVVAESGPLRPVHLPGHVVSRDRRPGDDPGAEPICTEKTDLVAALRKAGGNRSETARILGVTRTTVWNRIRKYNLTLEQVIQVK